MQRFIGQSDFTYYYHPDHLGSTGYVTDANGKLYEHLEYFPFGETWVQEHSNTLRTPYLFTGKEFDQETGLYYFAFVSPHRARPTNGSVRGLLRDHDLTLIVLIVRCVDCRKSFL